MVEPPGMRKEYDHIFYELFVEVKKLKDPLDQSTDDYNFFLSYLQYVNENIGEIKDNSTGRKHTVPPSPEACAFFGTTCAQLMYVILNKIVSYAASK
jgi:hypothetical protein